MALNKKTAVVIAQAIIWTAAIIATVILAATGCGPLQFVFTLTGCAFMSVIILLVNSTNAAAEGDGASSDDKPPGS